MVEKQVDKKNIQKTLDEINENELFDELKTYYECLDEINEDELFRGFLGFGLFSDRIPNFLSSELFFEFCKNENPEFKQRYFGYIKYENMRNINIPRILSIPNPFAYYKHCEILRDCWISELRPFFKSKTNDKFKISRIHIRKLKNKNSIIDSLNYDDIDDELKYNDIDDKLKDEIFCMKYKNYKIDGSPAQEIFIGKKYKIKADISNFFPSIYTHAICWALVGKEQAKIDRKDKELYYNKIDSSLQWLNYNETHGILIGPHTSNLISEIILVTIDDELKKKYEFIRNIDDYTCYTETKEKAEQFLIDLSKNLKDFGLSLNHKKTEIIELPISYDEEWKRKLNIFNFETHKNEIKFNSLVSFMDTALDLMKSNQNNAAILNYAIKTINNRKLTNNAKKYLIDTVHHLVLLFPYLVQILESIFEKFEITKDKIKSILDDLFNLGEKSRNFEALAYAIYFSLLYDLRLDKEENIITLVEQKEDCVFMLLSYIYSKKNKLDTKKYVKIATGYKVNDINNANFIILDDEFWLFAYEILKNEKPVELNEVPDWKKIKDKNISFISEKFKQYILDK